MGSEAKSFGRDAQLIPQTTHTAAQKWAGKGFASSNRRVDSKTGTRGKTSPAQLLAEGTLPQ